VVTFNKKKHSYVNENSDIEYISVTSLINTHKEAFDVDKQSKIVADREGVSQEEIIKRWDNIKKTACDFGTNLHNRVESHIVSKGKEYADDEQVIKFMKITKLKLADVLSETVVYNHEYRIAGTADIILDKGDTFDIYDLKTNKNFRFDSKFNKSLIEPLSHFPECEYSIYSLQVSTYAYLYHCMTGKKVGSLSLYWYDKENNEYSYYPTIYLHNDVKLMLEAFKRRGFKKQHK
jgi:hypothetical protein